MGWSGTHKEKSVSVRDFIQADVLSAEYRILGSASKGSTFYAAVRHPKGYIFAMVCLLKRNSRDHYNFLYKVIDETMGPVEADCPARILDLLDPTDSECANQWRAKCRARLAAPKIKLVEGTVIKFTEPLTFGRDLKAYTFKCIKDGRKTIFLAHFGLCRIPARILERAQVVSHPEIPGVLNK